MSKKLVRSLCATNSQLMRKRQIVCGSSLVADSRTFDGTYCASAQGFRQKMCRAGAQCSLESTTPCIAL